MQQITDHVYQIPLGAVNAYLLVTDAHLTVIDTGMPGQADNILAAVRELGKSPADVTHILLTHLHGDHIGSAPALQAATNAPVTIGKIDAPLIREGQAMRLPVHLNPAPLGRFISWATEASGADLSMDPVAVAHEVDEGDVLHDGIRVLFTPGHTVGHVSYLWNDVLFAGDVALNVFGRISMHVVHEDPDAARASLKRLAETDFDVAVFGHGRAIASGAQDKFRELRVRLGLT